ncbi:hypothetical protein B0H17DRAFT_1147191 [Mycena rosella]|uniref:Uncharacterized protein n=1 Tax=Mycena rosella TaxID=1033263 RepID=A0AAD7CMX4_MYCRO|nr:hypothetical protein B0H17DRAFT_1147191 [Mycena rosella]
MSVDIVDDSHRTELRNGTQNAYERACGNHRPTSRPMTSRRILAGRIYAYAKTVDENVILRQKVFDWAPHKNPYLKVTGIWDLVGTLKGEEGRAGLRKQLGNHNVMSGAITAR